MLFLYLVIIRTAWYYYQPPKRDLYFWLQRCLERSTFFPVDGHVHPTRPCTGVLDFECWLIPPEFDQPPQAGQAAAGVLLASPGPLHN